MSGPRPTPEQAAAIGAAGGDVLVEAGAGTGKTGVMVERYCRLLCEQGVPLEAVLAVTFTDKAAAELRERIRAGLRERADAGSERARELLGGLGGAWVTTIHGFCNRLLSAHPVAVGIDPGYRVLDAAEAERAAREAFDEALEDFLAGGEAARERTVAAYDVAGLRATVTAAHAELRSRGIEEPRLPEQAPPDVDAALRRAAEEAATALRELGDGKRDGRNRELAERALETLGGASPPGLDELQELCPSSSAQAMAAYREAIEAATARAAEAGEGSEAYEHVAELLRLFSSRFRAVKERRAGLDFEDLQLLAARLLEGTEVGRAYGSRFSHLLVDEFQDTNRLQLRLIEALRGPGCELMTVGDELQSIYGFRHADLEVFRETRRAMAESPGAEVLALSGNFRARPEPVAAVNAVGAALFGEDYRPLRVGAEPELPAPPGEGPPVELLLTAREGWDAEGIDLDPATDSDTPPAHLAEARLVAARLRELADAGVERGEMAVLLRAFTHLDAYEDALDRAGLRPYVVGGRGYWSQQQVADVRALLGAIANPLDDEALFGALASPACGAAPDTLWLLRAAAGRGCHVWRALRRAVGRGEAELAKPQRLEGIPVSELELLRSFAETLEGLRERAAGLPLAELIDAAASETGYDLAVLMRPAGEQRFANVRKLMRLAAEFEAAEGRDLRGLLDFLAARSERDTDAAAATAVEGHDGVRIMTVHAAKGLEFGVVAVPHLSRGLLEGSGQPPLLLGREQREPRVGMRLRRLGAAPVDLYAHRQLCEEAKEREAREELRLFHVAATRARERLLLSGVVKPKPSREAGPGTPVVERIVEAFGIDRESEASLPVPAPEPREGLEASFEPSEIAVRVNLPSLERAAELRRRRGEDEAAPDPGEGPPPLVDRRPPAVPNRPLSYTAISAYEDCAYRFQMERVLGLPSGGRTSSRIAEATATSGEWAAARGAAVHSLLQWSAGSGWREPDEELARRHARAAGFDAGVLDPAGELLAPLRAWLGSDLLAERVAAPEARVRAEVPFLLRVEAPGDGDAARGTVLRGAIDLLVERPGAAPLLVDYKTDRLDGADPAAELERRYEVQRAAYALAVVESRGEPQVEVAYVFLERPDAPVTAAFGPAELDEARARLAKPLARIRAGEFPPAPPERRDWELCGGCPALGGLCSGPSGD